MISVLVAVILILHHSVPLSEGKYIFHRMSKRGFRRIVVYKVFRREVFGRKLSDGESIFDEELLNTLLIRNLVIIAIGRSKILILQSPNVFLMKCISAKHSVIKENFDKKLFHKII